VRIFWKQSVLLLALAIGGIGDAAAELSLDFGVESFRWREFDSGAQLLEETGPRYRVGATWRQPTDKTERDLLQLTGTIYFGNIDYDGQACTLLGSCVPFKTDADYAGTTVEATLYHRVGANQTGELFAGGGWDRWRRDIKGSGAVTGAIEDWITFYLLAGGGKHWMSSGARYHVQAGVKYPIYTSNNPDAFSVTLEPKGRASLFARVSADFVSAGRAQWGIGVYYDSYRFAMSESIRAYIFSEACGYGAVRSTTLLTAGGKPAGPSIPLLAGFRPSQAMMAARPTGAVGGYFEVHGLG
jgi:hypothetical protein